MASFHYCGETAPHDDHEWWDSQQVDSLLRSQGLEAYAFYYVCPGVKADSELVRLIDQIELEELLPSSSSSLRSLVSWEE